MVFAGAARIGTDDALLNPRLAHRAKAVERPTAADRNRIAEALVGILRQAHDRDTISACLIALGKIGADPGFDVQAELVPFLQRNDQELRETAAVALGIVGVATTENVDLLLALARDEAAGRTASAQAAVNERTRAFAAYGLGLLLARSRALPLSKRIVEGLLPIVDGAEQHGRDLVVAAIEALAQFPSRWQGPGPNVLRHSIVDHLGAYYLRNLGPGDQLVQAHVPPALALLLLPGENQANRWKQIFMDDLTGGLPDGQNPSPAASRVNPHIAQSCALALGSLCAPWVDDTSPDAPACALLVRTYRQHKDQQVRSFALLALGRIGGAAARRALLQELTTASRALELPWVAMALGVQAGKEIEAALAEGRSAEADPTTTAALRRELAAMRNPNTLGALAIALGLCRDQAAADSLRAALREHSKRDDLAGYLCLGLGLMQDDRATGEIRGLLQQAERRPQVLLQSARALGLLGDHEVTTDLCRLIESPEPGLARLSAAAAALGQIGDRRSLEPLLRMARNPDLTPLTRAFAVVALGSICDKDPLPWNAAYASTTNYRAATATLTDGASGILDIL
jgi:HEAT repeat protein